jgi:Tfp pilus assembly protein PilV
MNTPATILSRRAGGFTLIEMVTSCIVLSMLMLSLGYGLKLVLVSTGNGALQSAQTLEAADVVERVADDLNVAMNFTEKTATAVTFTVPDREGGDADTDPDKISYQWWPTDGTVTIPGTTTTTTTTTSDGGLLGTGLLSGTTTTTTTTTTPDTIISVPAHSFTRRLNDGAPALIARDVRQLDLRYLYRTMPAPPAAERLLFSYEGGTSTTGINLKNAVGVQFLPSTVMPGVTSFRITRVQLHLRVNSLESAYGSAVEAALHLVNAGVFSDPPAELISHQVPEVALNRSLSTSQWVDFTFPNAPTWSTSGTQRYGISLRIASDTPGDVGLLNDAATVSHALFAGSPAKAGTAYATTSDHKSGSAWTLNSSHSLRYRVYGVATP